MKKSSNIPTPSPCRRRLGSLAGIPMLLVALSAGATSFADILAAERESVQAGVAAQARIDSLDDARADLLSQYRLALKQHEDLIKYNEQLRAIRDSQHDELASLHEQLQRVGNLEADILPLMTDMLEALDSFVALDAPFLLDQRRKRVAKLRQLFAASTVSHSEKYRRILEAYQIENDYGRTIEAYDASVQHGDSEQLVTFLKVGRVIFAYQTFDGRESRLWDRESRRWIPLDDRFNESIGRGIKMAREQIPSDLLLLPVSKAQF